MVTLNIKSVTSMPPEAAIGQQAGAVNQGSQAIAVGKQAGYQNQGANAIAIGAYAGYQNQATNSIILNASGSAVNATNAGFYVNPIRSVMSSTGVVSYTANEMTLTSNVIVNTVTATTFIGNGSQLTGLATPMSISNVQITDNTWVVLDDIAVSTDGGFAIVNGTGFAPGSMVRFGVDLATAVSYVSSNQLRVQAPVKTSGSYDVTVIRGDSLTATLALGMTYSAFPVWSTSTDLGNVTQNITFTKTLAATSDSNVTYSNTTSLPPQTTLTSNGTLSGNITSVADDTLYTFNVKATDVELQDVSRTFSLQYFLEFIARKLTASDKVANAGFGQAVSMSGDGTRIIIGANGDNGATGAAYIFVRSSGSNWTQEAKLFSADSLNNDRYAVSVSMDSTGTRVVVGDQTGNSVSPAYSGRAHVYVRSGTSWTRETILTASDRAANDYFGLSVSVNSDGSRIAVGVRSSDPGGTTDAGAVYIFSRSGSTWTQESKLTANDKAIYDYFGQAVSINSDGSRIAVGARGADPGGTADAGAVYIFTRSGTTWTQEAKVFANDKANYDYFGESVAINSDGTRIAVGAVYSDPGGTSDAGAVYIFSRSGSTWTQEAKVVANDKANSDYFGNSVAINSDGSRIAVGAYYADPGGVGTAGAAYVFTRSVATWTQEAKITASDKTTDDYFGQAVSMNSDGSRLIVGAPGADPGGTSYAGAVYVSGVSNGTWISY